MKTSLLLFSAALSVQMLCAEPAAPPSIALEPATPSPTRKALEVGVSATDGVSVSGGAALVTRNGSTTRLDKELKLTNGTRVQPDGTITFADGKALILHGDQVLTFDGAIVVAPPHAVPPPVTPTGIVMYDGHAYLIRGGRAFMIDATMVPDGQMLMNDGSLAPMPQGMDFRPTTGEASNDPAGGARRLNNGTKNTGNTNNGAGADGAPKQDAGGK